MGESTHTLWGITGEHLRQMVVRGLQVCVMGVPLIFTSAIQEYGTPKLVFAEVMVMVLAILWLLSMVLDGEVLIVDTPLYYTFFGFLAVGFVSLFLAYNIFQGLDVLFQQVCFFTLAVLVFHTVQTPEQIERITGTIVLTGGIVAIIGLLQHNAIYSFGSPWSLPISTIGNVNFTAQYYNAIFPISVAFLFVVRHFWARVGIGAACFFMVCHLVVLGSRGGWLGAGVSLVLLGMVGGVRYFQIGRRLVDFAVVSVVIVGLGWPVLAGMVGSIRLDAGRDVNGLVMEYWERTTHRIENAIRLEDDSSLQRVQLWEDTTRLILDRPLLGVGLGNFEFSIPQYMSQASLAVKHRRELAVGHELMAFSAHNEYLEIWAEIGLLGFLVFGFLLFQVGVSVLDLMRRYIGGEVSFLAVGLAGSVLATLVHSFFSTNLQQPTSAVHFWLVVGLVWSFRLHVEWLSSVGILATGARKVAVALMVLCGFALVVSLVVGARTIVGEVYYRRGEQAFRAQAYDVAQLQWQSATGYSPTRSYRIYQALGTALYNQKKWDEAIDAFEQSLIYFPHNARVHHLLGRAFVQTGNALEAVVQGQKAVDLNPLSFDFLIGYGEALFKHGKSAEAIGVLEQALVLRPHESEVHRLLGASHKSAGNLEAAVLSYQQALEISPDDVDVLNGLAVIFSEQGNFERAHKYLTQAVALAPNQIDYRFNLGLIQLALSEYDAALNTLNQVLAQAPNLALAYVMQGKVLALMGSEQEARQALDKALQLAPNDPQVRKMLKDMGWE